MPRNNKESIIYLLLMLFIMIPIMMAYRLLLSEGEIVFSIWLMLVIRTIIIAFIVNRLVTNRLAHKIVDLTGVSKNTFVKPSFVMTIFSVLFMTTVMIFIGMILSDLPITFKTYTTTWLTSVIVSVPTCFLVARPTAQKVLKKYQNKINLNN